MATVSHRIATANTAVGPLTSGAFTPAAGELLIGLVVATATVDATAAMTNSLGITFTKITSAVKNASADTIYLFVANQFAVASSQTCTITFPGDNSNGQVIFVAGVGGMTRTGSGAVRQSAVQNNGAAAGTPAPAFSVAALTTNPCLGLVGNGTNPAGMTPPSGWTEGVADTGYATPNTGAEYVFRSSGFTGTTVTWGSTSATAFGALVVELDASAPLVWLNATPRIIPSRIVTPPRSRIITILTAAPAGPGGAGEIPQRSATDSTVRKNGAGTGAATGRTSTASTGSKNVTTTGIGTVSQRSSVAGAARKQAANVGDTAQRNSTTAASRKQGAGVGVIPQRSTLAADIRHQGVGVGVVAQRSSTQAETTPPGPNGAGQVVQRSTTVSTGSKNATAAGAVTVRATVQGAAVKTAVVAGAVAVRTSTRSTGVKTGIAAGAVTVRTTSSATVKKTVAGATTVVVRSSTIGSATRRATGVGLVQQRSTTEATHGPTVTRGAVTSRTRPVSTTTARSRPTATVRPRTRATATVSGG